MSADVHQHGQGPPPLLQHCPALVLLVGHHKCPSIPVSNLVIYRGSYPLKEQNVSDDQQTRRNHHVKQVHLLLPFLSPPAGDRWLVLS
jgi:hypothetical protein